MFLQNFSSWKPVRAVAALLLASITVISCTSPGSTSEPIAQNQKTLINPYEWVGAMHNDGLDYVRNQFLASESLMGEIHKIKFSNENSNTKIQKSLTVIAKASDEIALDFMKLNPNVNQQDIERAKKMESARLLLEQNILGVTDMRIFKPNVLRLVEQSTVNLSDKEKYYINKVFTLTLNLAETNESNEIGLKKLAALEQEMLSQKWERNEVMALSIIATARASATYHISSLNSNTTLNYRGETLNSSGIFGGTPFCSFLANNAGWLAVSVDLIGLAVVTLLFPPAGAETAFGFLVAMLTAGAKTAYSASGAFSLAYFVLCGA